MDFYRAHEDSHRLLIADIFYMKGKIYPLHTSIFNVEYFLTQDGIIAYNLDKEIVEFKFFQGNDHQKEFFLQKKLQSKTIDEDASYFLSALMNIFCRDDEGEYVDFHLCSTLYGILEDIYNSHSDLLKFYKALQSLPEGTAIPISLSMIIEQIPTERFSYWNDTLVLSKRLDRDNSLQTDFFIGVKENLGKFWMSNRDEIFYKYHQWYMPESLKRKING